MKDVEEAFGACYFRLERLGKNTKNIIQISR